MQQGFPTLPTQLQPQIISGCVASFDKDFLESCLVNKTTQNVSLLLLQVLTLVCIMGTVYHIIMKSYMLWSTGSLHNLCDYKLFE